MRRGIDIILGQNRTDYEVILVDDGSTDRCGEMCDEFASACPQVRVVHLAANGGTGLARNAGVDAARGEYVMFFDFDDRLRPGALELLRGALERHRPDLLVFSYRMIEAATGAGQDFVFRPAVYGTNAELRGQWAATLSSSVASNGFVWNKVYRRAFLIENNLWHEPLRIQQDEVFNLSVYPRAGRTVVLGNVLYDYYVYNSGNTRSRYIKDRFEIYRRIREAFLEMMHGWGVETPGLRSYVENRFLTNTTVSIDYNLYHPDCPMTPGQRRGELRRILSSDALGESVGWLRQTGRVPGSFVRRLYFEAMERRSVWLYTVARHVNAGYMALRRTVRIILNKAGYGKGA